MSSSALASQIPLDSKLSLHSVAPLANPNSLHFDRNHRRHRHLKIPIPAAFKKKSRQLRKLRRSQVWKTGTRVQQVEEMAQWFPNLPPGGSVKGLSNPFLARYDEVGFGVCGVGGSLMAKVKSADGCFGAEFKCDGDVFGDGDVFSDKKDAIGPINSEFGQKLLMAKEAFERMQTAHKESKRATPKSDIGTLKKLPGEIRNEIYRLAVLEPDGEVMVSLEDFTCRGGPCFHRKATYNLPGIINTCRQIRAECGPICFAEHDAFVFDADVVHQRCVGNYIRSVGHYIDLVKKFKFQLLRPLWRDEHFMGWNGHMFTIIPPHFSESKWFELSQEACWPRAHEARCYELCECTVRKEIRRLNTKMLNTYPHDPFLDDPIDPKASYDISEYLLNFFESDVLDDWVFRTRKNSSEITVCKLCKKCRGIRFPDWNEV
ncbi:unnamed protein product [Cercospora beticola]|nr:unnamed protein product [Cercospora beticola]